MRLAALSLKLALGLVLLTQCFARRNKNPCHPGRRVELLGCDCEGIVMPRNLCTACQIGSYGTDGLFDDCTSMYRISEPACRAQLQQYVDLNTCDDVRRGQLETFDTNPDSVVALDYFVYSVCEECCDCVPRHSRSEQFDDRKEAGVNELTALARGNCPAHAHYDICRVWPEVRYVTRPGGNTYPNRPKVCPLVREWFFSPLSQGWFGNDMTMYDNRIRRFLNQYNRIARCRKKDIWQACTDLETAQNRI